MFLDQEEDFLFILVRRLLLSSEVNREKLSLLLATARDTESDSDAEAALPGQASQLRVEVELESVVSHANDDSFKELEAGVLLYLDLGLARIRRLEQLRGFLTKLHMKDKEAF